MIKGDLKKYSNLVLYDGKNQNLSSVEFKFGCQVCGNEILVEPLYGNRVSEIEEEALRMEIVKKLALVEIEISGAVFYKTRDSLKPFVSSICCDCCKERYLLVSSFGEIQPARYKLIINRVFRI